VDAINTRISLIRYLGVIYNHQQPPAIITTITATGNHHRTQQPSQPLPAMITESAGQL
jgi:hypothetical protein